MSPPCSTINRRFSFVFPVGAVRNKGEAKTVEVATGCSVRALEIPGGGTVLAPPPPLSPLQAPSRRRDTNSTIDDTGQDMLSDYYEKFFHSTLKLTAR